MGSAWWRARACLALALALSVLPCTVSLAGEALTAEWHDGFQIKSADKAFSAKIGGRIMSDWAFIAESDDVPMDYRSHDGTELRRARLYMSGTIHRFVIFKSQWDFAGGKVVPKDVYLGLTGLPAVGTVRVGNFKEPFGLDELTSSKYITFMERGLHTAFAPSRNPGIMFSNTHHDERMTWAAGIFRDDAADGGAGTATGDSEYAETVRITGLPVYEDGGRTLLHIGGAFSHRQPPDDERSYSFRPENHLGAKVLGSGDIQTDNVVLLSGEAALVAGPVSVQGEVVHAAHSGGDEEPSFMAMSGFVSFFVTGENRPYKKSEAAFSRVKPKKNFDPDTGDVGAVELAARVSRVDLEDKAEGADNGTLTDVTLGANWYLNPSTRVMINYVLGHVDRPDWDGDVQTFQTRFQIDF